MTTTGSVFTFPHETAKTKKKKKKKKLPVRALKQKQNHNKTTNCYVRVSRLNLQDLLTGWGAGLYTQRRVFDVYSGTLLLSAPRRSVPRSFRRETRSSRGQSRPYRYGRVALERRQRVAGTAPPEDELKRCLLPSACYWSSFPEPTSQYGAVPKDLRAVLPIARKPCKYGTRFDRVHTYSDNSKPKKNQAQNTPKP